MSSNSKSINLAALQLFAGKAFDQETREASRREEEGRHGEEREEEPLKKERDGVDEREKRKGI